MQSTQWKNRTKSAGFSSFLSSYSTSQSKTDQNIVLNINGKKLAESTISNSSSIWDYNPDDLKVKQRNDYLKQRHKSAKQYYYKPPLDLNIQHGVLNTFTNNNCIGPTVHLKSSDVFNYMPTSSLSPSSSSSSAASSNNNNKNLTPLKPQLIPEMVSNGQHHIHPHIIQNQSQTEPINQPPASISSVEPPAKQLINIASTYAIENDSFHFGFNDRNQPLYASKEVEPVRVKQKFPVKEPLGNTTATPPKYTTKSLTIHDQFGSESLKKNYPVQVNPVNLKPKLDALNSREKITVKQRDVNSASSQTLKLIYGKHIDELTSDLISNLSKDLRNKKIEEAVVEAEDEEDEEEIDEEVDYEDVRGEYSEFYEILSMPNKSDTGNIEKLINDIKLIKRDRSVLSRSESECSRNNDVFIKNYDTIIDDPNHHQKYLGKVNYKKVLEFEQKNHHQLWQQKQQIKEEEKKRRQKEVNEREKAKRLTESKVVQNVTETNEKTLPKLDDKVVLEIQEDPEENNEATNTVKSEPLIDEKGDFIYAEVMSRECRKLLNKYDNLDYSADQFIRNNLSLIPPECASAALADLRASEENFVSPTAREYDNNYNPETVVEQSNGQSVTDLDSADTFNLLKRLLVKKKYTLYTIKQENVFKNKRLKRINTAGITTSQQQQQQQQQQQPINSNIQSNQQQLTNGGSKPGLRPSTASVTVLEPVTLANVEKLNQQNQQNQQLKQQKSKLNRPRTANTIPGNLKFGNYSSATRYQEPTNSSSQQTAEIQTTNQLSQNLEEYYYPYRSTAAQSTVAWPFELEFDRYVKKRNYCSNKTVVQINRYLKDAPINPNNTNNSSNNRRLSTFRPPTEYCSTEISLNTCNTNKPLNSLQGISPQPQQIKYSHLNMSTKAFPMKSLFFNTNCNFIYHLEREPSALTKQPQQQQSINLNEVSGRPPGRILTYANATLSSSRRCFSAKTAPISSNQHTRNLINYSINSGKNIQENFKNDVNNIDKTLQSNGKLKHIETVKSYPPEQQIEKNDQPEKLEQTLASSSKHSIGRLSSARRNMVPGKTVTSQRKNSISYEHVVTNGKKIIELQQLKVPLTQYQVSGAAKNFYSAAGTNIEGLKELALQHQKDIFALSPSENGSNTSGSKLREIENRVLVYGVSSEVKKDSKLKEIVNDCFVDLKEPRVEIEGYGAYQSVAKNTGHLQNSLGNTRKFRSILVESNGNSESASNRPKTAKI